MVQRKFEGMSNVEYKDVTATAWTFTANYGLKSWQTH